jgi:hypothetical protein
MEKLIDKAPEIIKESAKSPLGIIALAILVLLIMAAILFDESPDVVKGVVFTLIVISLLSFVGVAVFYALKSDGNQDEVPESTPGNRNDTKLFEQFHRLFADNDLIKFYKEHDFLGSFQKDKI